MAIGLEDSDVFKQFVAALAGAMRQEIPDVSDTRAEFAVDDIPYVLTADSGSPAVFVCAVIGALPQDEAERAHVFAKLLHAQYCFSDSCGFSFGVDDDDSFVLLQALVNTECVDERHFVELMEKFIQTANVWSKRLGESASAEASASELRSTADKSADKRGMGNGGDFAIQV